MPLADVVRDVPPEERAALRNRRDGGRAETMPVSRVRSGQASSLLAARAAEEYAYVARDVRHIAIVGGGLGIVLLILYVLVQVVHVIPL